MTSTRVCVCLGIYHKPAQGQPILPLQARHGLLHSEQLCWSIGLQVSLLDCFFFFFFAQSNLSKMVNMHVESVIAAGYV